MSAALSAQWIARWTSLQARLRTGRRVPVCAPMNHQRAVGPRAVGTQSETKLTIIDWSESGGEWIALEDGPRSLLDRVLRILRVMRHQCRSTGSVGIRYLLLNCLMCV